jgi:DNA replication and repair protein RecF
MELADLRIVRRASLEFGRSLNVFFGDNAQGKTSLLEGLALLARGRSFRTDHTPALIRRGAPALLATGVSVRAQGQTRLAVEVQPGGRELRVDGLSVAPGAYQGRLEAVVYSTERLQLLRGPMRARRQYLDRGGAALWPGYRQLLAEFGRVLAQRNAALAAGSGDLAAWDERFVSLGARLRQLRARYAQRLQEALERGYRPAGERYLVATPPAEARDEDAAERLRGELLRRAGDERRVGRSLAGPQRDPVRLRVNGEAAETASSGQARSLVLALTLAALDVYREERGETPVALLDDLDSELDQARAATLCALVAERGQAFVTTAHPGWTGALPDARRFEVVAGSVRRADA